jgi:Polysaccharide lyase
VTPFLREWGFLVPHYSTSETIRTSALSGDGFFIVLGCDTLSDVNVDRYAKLAILPAAALVFAGGFLVADLGCGSDTDGTATFTNAATYTIPTMSKTETDTVTRLGTTQPPPPTTRPAGGALIWSADHETGDGSQWPGITSDWDDAGCIEHRVVADGHAHSGSYSMKMTIDGSGLPKAGCRQARTQESQSGKTYVYEAWFYLPRDVLTKNNHWDNFAFKSKCGDCSSSDPIWTIDWQGDPLRPILTWRGGNYGLAGPFSSSGVKSNLEFQNELTTVPYRRWTRFTVLLDQSTGFDGHITVWQDGRELYDLANVRTQYASGDSRWLVNNYSNGLTVNPYTLYIDDASVREP